MDYLKSSYVLSEYVSSKHANENDFLEHLPKNAMCAVGVFGCHVG